MKIDVRTTEPQKLIEDIQITAAEPQLQQSIGSLDEEYLRRRLRTRPDMSPASDMPPITGRTPAAPPPLLQFSGVPHSAAYAQIWDPLLRAFAGACDAALSAASSAKAYTVAAGTGVAAFLYQHRLAWLPRAYSAVRGLHTNWSVPVFRNMRWITPLLVLMAGILIIALARLLPDGDYILFSLHHDRLSAADISAQSSSVADHGSDTGTSGSAAGSATGSSTGSSLYTMGSSNAANSITVGSPVAADSEPSGVGTPGIGGAGSSGSSMQPASCVCDLQVPPSSAPSTPTESPTGNLPVTIPPVTELIDVPAIPAVDTTSLDDATGGWPL